MSLWQRIKIIAAAILAVAAAVFAALFYREKAKREQDKRKASEGARRTERKATDAMTEGLTHEQEAAHAAKTRRTRDHFER